MLFHYEQSPATDLDRQFSRPDAVEIMGDFRESRGFDKPMFGSTTDTHMIRNHDRQLKSLSARFYTFGTSINLPSLRGSRRTTCPYTNVAIQRSEAISRRSCGPYLAR